MKIFISTLLLAVVIFFNFYENVLGMQRGGGGGRGSRGGASSSMARERKPDMRIRYRQHYEIGVWKCHGLVNYLHLMPQNNPEMRTFAFYDDEADGIPFRVYQDRNQIIQGVEYFRRPEAHVEDTYHVPVLCGHYTYKGEQFDLYKDSAGTVVDIRPNDVERNWIPTLTEIRRFGIEEVIVTSFKHPFVVYKLDGKVVGSRLHYF